MAFSAFASPPPQQLVEDLTTDLRYHQHNVDDTRYHLSHRSCVTTTLAPATS